MPEAGLIRQQNNGHDYVHSVSPSIYGVKNTKFFYHVTSKAVPVIKIIILYNLFDSGLANSLALGTYRHGTSFKNFFKIWFGGGKVFCGGGKDGASAYEFFNIYENTCKGKIHVWNEKPSWGDLDPSLKKIAMGWPIIKRTIPSVFSRMANSVMTARLLKRPIDNENVSITSLPIFALTFLTPTIKYRFTPEKFKSSFHIDNDLAGLASYTITNISVAHLGIAGSLIQGLNSRILDRIKNNPRTFLLGCAQLVAAVALTIFWTADYFKNSSINTDTDPVKIKETRPEPTKKYLLIKNLITQIALNALWFSTW